jgi:putative ABC transport system substrate-binding protein
MSYQFRSAAMLLLLVVSVAVRGLGDSASAQTGEPLRRVAGLSGFGCDKNDRVALVFRHRLMELGWIEEKNLVLDCVSTLSVEQLPLLAAELIGRRPDVLVASPIAYIRALKQATATIPIVMVSTTDPVENGLVTNFPRPEANVTGIASTTPELISKRIELLKEMLPRLKRFAVIHSGPPGGAYSRVVRENVALAAARFGFAWREFTVAEPNAVDGIFAQLGAEGFDAVYLPPTPLIYTRQTQIAAMALRYRVAPVSDLPSFATSGFLLTYGPDVLSLWIRGAEYVDKILRGANPGDLPVEQPSKFSLVINLNTAQALGVTVPPSLLSRASELVE